MKLRLLAVILMISLMLGGCAFIEGIFGSSCMKNTSDKYVLRASAEATSSTVNLAMDKATAEARRNILEQADGYIADKYSYEVFLKDGDYEQKIDTMRSRILESCEVTCNHAKPKGGVVIYSTTLQINISKIDEIIKECK